MHRLQEKLHKRLTGEWYGAFDVLFQGQGVTISDIRRYQPGDHISAINWKQTAKRDQLYVNEYDAERLLSVDIFLDINANRSTGGKRTYRSVVQDFLGDYILFARPEKFRTRGFLNVYGDEQPFATTLITEKNRISWIDQAEHLVEQSKENSYESRLPIIFRYLQAMSKRRVVIVVSDFQGVSPEDLALLRRLEQRHVLITVQVDIPQIVGRGWDAWSVRPISNEGVQPVVRLVA